MLISHTMQEPLWTSDLGDYAFKYITSRALAAPLFSGVELIEGFFRNISVIFF